MATYTPDLWVIIKLDNDGEEIYKLLATWYGGYTSGDSWKLNSGITGASVNTKDGSYDVHGHSGSTYNVASENWGTSFYSGSILAGWLEDHPGKLTVLGEDEAVAYLDKLSSDA